MNDDLFGERLGVSLREHSPASPTSLSLADVRGRATSIRRRRRATAAGALAAVLAVLGPVAVTALGNDRASEPVGPAGPVVSPTPSVSLPPEVTLAKDAPKDRGAEGDWFRGDAELSRTLSIPEASQDGVTVLGQRWLVEYAVDGDRKLYSIDLDEDAGTTAEAIQAARTYPLHGRVAVSDGQDLAAFSTPDGELTLVDAEGRTRVVTDLPTGAGVVDLVGDAGCLDGTDCELVVSYGDGRAPELVSGDGTRTAIDPDATAATAATDGLVATLERAASPGEYPCAVVRDRRTLGEVWRSCKVRVDSFSPDGRLVQVVDSDVDGLGPRRFGLAEATTGTLLTWIEVDAEQGFAQDVTWTPEGGLEVLSHTFDDRKWRLHHVALDGTVSQRAEARSGSMDEPPWFSGTLP